MALVVGGRACVHSLAGRPELNGELVSLLSYDDAASRWTCRTSDGGRVALRVANLQPMRDGGAPPPSAARAWARRLASLPWAHFAGGLLVTLLVGQLFLRGGGWPGGGGKGGGGRAAAGGARKAFGARGGLGAGFGGLLGSFASLCSGLGARAPGLSDIPPGWIFLALVAVLVWMLFVDAGGGARGTPLQWQVRAGVARAAAAVQSLSHGLTAFQAAIVACGALGFWALWTEQLVLNTDASRLILLPIVLYTLYSYRNNLHNMNPFQLLWLLDMLLRMFQPGGARRRTGGFGGGGFGLGGGGFGGYRRPFF
ncbi:hypothetical protein T492DRAFT_958670 [Pavlovales sp. CCMP2436]|nr:hypothetical protein T492DRAFT_958670 [Pavlovales sp. CCMP2436]